MARNKLLVLALVLGCAAASPGSLAAQIETTPQGAVNAFMKAVADSNLPRMTELWGTEKGPAAKTRQPPDFQKRIYITYAFLKGGSYTISATEPSPAEKDKRYMILEYNRADCHKLVPITAVKTKNDGWIVTSLDLTQVGVPGRPCGGAMTPDSAASVAPVPTPGAAAPVQTGPTTPPVPTPPAKPTTTAPAKK